MGTNQAKTKPMNGFTKGIGTASDEFSPLEILKDNFILQISVFQEHKI